jgi:hypothetical protein
MKKVVVLAKRRAWVSLKKFAASGATLRVPCPACEYEAMYDLPIGTAHKPNIDEQEAPQK